MAELKKMYCPSCGGELNLDTKRLTTGQVITCPYCGNRYAYVDPNEKRIHKHITIDQNINENINYHKTIEDKAAIEREKTRQQESEERESRTSPWEALVIIAFFIFALILLL